MAPDPRHSDPPHDPAGDPDEHDLRLATAAQQGDRAALAELLARYQDRLYTVCVRMLGNRQTATDLTQDAFVRLIQGLGSFDGKSRFSTWAIRVTMNACLTHLRGARLRRHASLDGPERGGSGDRPGWSGEPGVEPGPDQRVQLSERRGLVAAGLDLLEPDQRALLILRDVQDLPYEQIAAALDIPLGTVKSRIFRARLALRGHIESLQRGRQGAPPEPFQAVPRTRPNP
ncbi:MAG TPA: RNA polymerase sigma factor [Phycisphaerales bacterium]|nr:RNA polymerase sigma factor [Phycisphaerales bacterium]